ncbi:ESPR-type extended signal peptide-containing protein, partial [Haemophilus sp. CCUG 66565]|uniref:ESPR-type extended signal peptide-containing protein n=1 Tax=Haemophilus sp. CCUG 66565 TaxID=1859694 RepID=UPI000ADA5B11
MNHIYKVIWNTITQTWVAVSELSRAKGKTKSSKTLSAVVLAAVSAGAIIGDAEAATNFVQNQTGIAITRTGGDAPAQATDRWAIAVGDSAKATNEYSIAVGGHTNAAGESAIAIGKQTQAHETGATAVGRVTLANKQYSSAYGAQAKATGNQSTALGYVANAAATNSLAAGALAQAQGESSVALGRDAQAWGSGASAVGEGSRANNSNAFAGGNGAQATGSWATAVGPSTLASGEASVAYGDSSQATGKKSIATGSHASASEENAIALGTTASATKTNATAIGNNSEAKANNTIAIGNGTKATDKAENSLVIGQGAVVTAKDATVVGPVAQANGENATAVGRGAAANGTESTALGRGSVATGNQSIALGKGANAKVDSGVALGDDSVADRTARSQNGIVINTSDPSKSTGFNTENSVYAPVRLVDAPEALNLIKNTIKGNKGAVSVGDSGNTRQIINVAAGSADSDAVNVAQLKAVAGAIKHYDVVSPNGDITVTHPDPHDPNKTVWNLNLNPDRVKEITKWKLRDVEENGNPKAGQTDALVKGDETVTFQDTDTIDVERDGRTLKFKTKKNIKYFSVNSSGGTNEDNKGATGDNAIAIGKDASSTGSSAVSLGLGAKALGANNTAIGPGAQAKDVRTTAIGYNANASEASAVGIGYAANAAKSRSLAIGQDATASANNAIALGSSKQHGGDKTTASAEHAVAIGSGADANIANGIALGSESKTTTDKGQSGFDASTHDERANHYDGLKGKTLTSNLAGLSIGNGDKTRQINHLAAGKADDDAVNVAQLKSVNLAFKGDNNTKGDVRLHDQRLSVVGVENSFITTKAGDNKLEIGTTQGTFSTTDGKSSAPKQGLATTTTVASAINDSGWEVRAKGTKVGLVNPGDKVDFTNADKSIEIESFAEANGLSTIKFKAVTETIQTEEKSPITQIDVNGSTVSKTTKGKNEPTGRFVVPTGDKANKYALATAYDVADKVNQTGWNLYTNGGARSLINPGDYVNFKSGNATNAKVVTEASEGATISYDVNVDNTTIKIDSNGNKLTANTGDVDSVTNTEGTSKKGQVTIHKDPLEPSKTDSGKLATVDTVVKAVNNAKWFTIAKDSDDKVTGETKTNESEGTAMAAGETLGLNAGKNLRLKREANTNNFTFALDSNLKDLDSVHTKEIKLGESNNPISIKNDGDRITYTTKGGNNSDVTHKVANLEDEKHIKPTTDGNEYTVDASGNITMTYADGNNKDVTNTKAVIKGVAKNDLSNITNDGKKAITTLGSVVKAGDNVLVDEDTDAITGKKTYTVNAVTPVVYTDKQGNRVYKVKDGNGYKFTKNADGTGEVVNKSDVIASFYDGNNSTTAGTMIVNNIGSAINNAGNAGDNYLTKLEVAASATGTPNAAVNVSDLHNTAEALRSNEIHIAPTTDKAEGKEATHYKYDADKKQVVMTYQDGKGNDVADKKAVIDLSSLADSVHNYGFKANATGNGSTGASAQDVANGTTVNFDAGKNLTVKQTVDATSKHHTYSFALSNNVDLTNAGSITVGGTKVDNGGITINAATPSAGETKKPDVTLTNTGLSNGDNHITNVKGNLPDTYNTAEGDKTITKKQDAPTSITSTNAATVGDVLNAGWNLQGNGNEIDFVKPYDTVNFANGTGTTATVTNTDGKTTTVKYDVATGKGLEVTDNKVTVKTDGDTITVGDD